jgi:putative membrane protein insertion efficiency factor
MKNVIKKFILYLLWFYKTAVSPYKAKCCRFYPSCSSYAIEAVKRHGVFKGLFLATKRLLRCHPFNKGGYDPVP